MQTLVIGDIHGCYDELQALLDKAGLPEDDSIVSFSDCVDRGPDTPTVLRFFQEKLNAKLIMGNHNASMYVLIGVKLNWRVPRKSAYFNLERSIQMLWHS